jgi:hypothetical protein
MRTGLPAYAERPQPAPVRKRRKTSRSSNRGLIIGLAVGGAAFVLLVVLGGVATVVALNWKSKSDSGTTVAQNDSSPNEAAIAPGPAAQPAPKKQGVLDLLEGQGQGGFEPPPPPAFQPPADPVPPPAIGRPGVPIGPIGPRIRRPGMPMGPGFRPNPGMQNPGMPNPGRVNPGMPRAPQPAGPEWRPDPDQLVRLDSPTVCGSFQIRPPRGYTLQRRRMPSSELFQWKGAPRPDGTFPQLLAVLVPLPAGGENVSVDQIFDPVVDRFKKEQAGIFSTWMATGKEQGQINGIAFMRTRIRGSTTAGAPMSGFIYMGIDNAHAIFVVSEDIAPYDREALPLSEASTLTLRR